MRPANSFGCFSFLRRLLLLLFDVLDDSLPTSCASCRHVDFSGSRVILLLNGKINSRGDDWRGRARVTVGMGKECSLGRRARVGDAGRVNVSQNCAPWIHEIVRLIVEMGSWVNAVP